MEVTTGKISKSEAKKSYKELIGKDPDALEREREKSSDIRKYNMQDLLNNVGSIFTTDIYLHYKDVPKETMFERSIAEQIKLRKERFDEIKRERQNINNELFKAYFIDYQSPSSMCKKLSKIKDSQNEGQVDLVQMVLTKMKKIIENVPKEVPLKIAENEEIIDIVEKILEVNNKT